MSYGPNLFKNRENAIANNNNTHTHTIYDNKRSSPTSVFFPRLERCCRRPSHGFAASERRHDTTPQRWPCAHENHNSRALLLHFTAVYSAERCCVRQARIKCYDEHRNLNCFWAPTFVPLMITLKNE